MENDELQKLKTRVAAHEAALAIITNILASAAPKEYLAAQATLLELQKDDSLPAGVMAAMKRLFEPK